MWHPSGRSDGAEDGVCVFAVEVRKGVLNFLFFCFNSITELAQSKEQEKAKMRQRPPPPLAVPPFPSFSPAKFCAFRLKVYVVDLLRCICTKGKTPLQRRDAKPNSQFFKGES